MMNIWAILESVFFIQLSSTLGPGFRVKVVEVEISLQYCFCFSIAPVQDFMKQFKKSVCPNMLALINGGMSYMTIWSS